MELPSTCEAAVFDPATGRFRLEQFRLRPPGDGEVLVRVSLSAICGSDLHTVRGRRHPGGPIVLGHEVCGRVAAFGPRPHKDLDGPPLRVGDRITWSIMASCGGCFFCTRDMPQKCESLFKYGHETTDRDTPLSGGFAGYIYLKPGTALIRLADDLPDETVVFANCSMATMCAAVRMAGVSQGESVLILGAGPAGLCAAALSAAKGARSVMVTDVLPERLALARRFGATTTCDAAEVDEAAFRNAVERAAGRRGFDVAIEACGRPEAAVSALGALRIGGRFVVVGCVFPNASCEIDLHVITTRLITIKGLHNYTPRDLAEAVEFIATRRDTFPFDEVVGDTFPLSEIEGAVAESSRQGSGRASQGRKALRIAIRPGHAEA